MALIEGLDDAIEREYDRLRTELRLAIAESGYTIAEIGALADVEQRTIYRMLAGNDVKLRDTLLRVLFAVGGHIEINRPAAEGSRPFQVVPSEQRSLGSVRSSQVSGKRSLASNESATRDSNTATRKVVAKKASQQQRKRPRRKGVTGWSPRSAPYLRERSAFRAIRPGMTIPGSKAA